MWRRRAIAGLGWSRPAVWSRHGEKLENSALGLALSVTRLQPGSCDLRNYRYRLQEEPFLSRMLYNDL